MELYVLFALRDAPNLDAWKVALAERNLPVSVTADIALETLSGFLPMQLENKDTGLYFVIDNYAELATQFPALKEIPIAEPVVYSLGYGGHLDEGAVAIYSAFALTAEFNGIAFDPQGGAIVPSEALLEAAKLFQEMARTP
ncbi:MAG TPA: hypothetical protein VIR45_07090 [Kiloniellaceae bacterium]